MKRAHGIEGQVFMTRPFIHFHKPCLHR